MLVFGRGAWSSAADAAGDAISPWATGGAKAKAGDDASATAMTDAMRVVMTNIRIRREETGRFGVTGDELMQFVKGPDFPTGGILYRYREEGKDEEDTDAIAQGYSVGKSRLILQAKAHFEQPAEVYIARDLQRNCAA